VDVALLMLLGGMADTIGGPKARTIGAHFGPINLSPSVQYCTLFEEL
jgi:hypothetical protein